MNTNPQATLDLSGTAPLGAGATRRHCMDCKHSVYGAGQARESASGLCYRPVKQTGRSVRWHAKTAGRCLYFLESEHVEEQD